MTLGVIVAYLIAVVAVGVWSHRLLSSTGEGYFLAGRSIGPFVLLMTLFGTHMTSFALLGSSAQAYQTGVGVFALMASSSAFVAPVVFLFIGTRVWSLGKRYGYVTQVQYLRDRFASNHLGLVLFLLLTALLVPYLLIGVMGGGIALAEVTGGQVPEWVGGLLVSVVVLAYVGFGGMRSTAWVNTMQTLIFMSLGAVTMVVILGKMGGLGSAMRRVAGARPDLVTLAPNVGAAELLTYTLIPLSVATFPHIFAHWLSARSAAAFRIPVIFYPLCVAIVWLPTVVLGVLGRLDFPDLVGPQANSVLVRMIDLHAPDLLAGLLGAGVFAAIMSSLDSQSLALGAMFTEDIVQHYAFAGGMSERAQVWTGRLFVALIISITFVLSLYTERSIFGLAVWSFSGFSALTPVIVAALYWRRATAAAAWASVVVVAALWLFFFVRASEHPGYSVGGTGVMPVAVIFAGSLLTMVAVSLVTPPPPAATVARFFPDGATTGGEA